MPLAAPVTSAVLRLAFMPLLPYPLSPFRSPDNSPNPFISSPACRRAQAACLTKQGVGPIVQTFQKDQEIRDNPQGRDNAFHTTRAGRRFHRRFRLWVWRRERRSGQNPHQLRRAGSQLGLAVAGETRSYDASEQDL